MKIKIFIFFILAGLFSCQREKSKEEIEAKISEYKDEIEIIQDKIDNLNAELQNLPGGLDANEDRLKVSVHEIRPQSFHHYVEVSGIAEAVNEAFISPEINGQIMKVHVSEGQRVSKGRILISLSDEIIRNNIKEVKTGLELAKTMYKKQKNLYEKKIGSEVQYLQAKNNKESLEQKLATLHSQLDKSQIRAPFSGIVDEIFIKEGELAVPGRQVIRLVDLSNMFIEADISENFLPRIQSNDTLTVGFPAYPDISFKGTIEFIGNVINPQNRTFRIKVKMKNRGSEIKPNLMAMMSINDYSADSVLLVPSIVIKQDFNGSFLYVVRKSDNGAIAEKKYVETGMSDDVHTIVSKGISVGDKVIVKGYNLVKDGTKINIQ